MERMMRELINRDDTTHSTYTLHPSLSRGRKEAWSALRSVKRAVRWRWWEVGGEKMHSTPIYASTPHIDIFPGMSKENKRTSKDIFWCFTIHFNIPDQRGLNQRIPVKIWKYQNIIFLTHSAYLSGFSWPATLCHPSACLTTCKTFVSLKEWNVWAISSQKCSAC